MARNSAIAQAAPTAVLPEVRTIRPADLYDVLAKGLGDFRAMPSHVVFLSLIYPVIGLLLRPIRVRLRPAADPVSADRRLCPDRSARCDRAL